MLLHLQLHSGEYARLTLPHLQLVQSPLQEHFISSLHALDTTVVIILWKFLPNLSSTLAPLYELLKLTVKWRWMQQEMLLFRSR